MSKTDLAHKITDSPLAEFLIRPRLLFAFSLPSGLIPGIENFELKSIKV